MSGKAPGTISCPECGHRLDALRCPGCEWRGSRLDRSYLRANFARFPLAFFGVLGIWALAFFLGGVALGIAGVWTLFFLCLIKLTLSQAKRIGKPRYDASLCPPESARLQTRAQQLYACSYEELVETYQERCQMLERASRARSNQLTDLTLVSAARLRKVNS